MTLSRPTFTATLLATCFTVSTAFAAQPAETQAQPPQAQEQPGGVVQTSPSAILQPALASIQQALNQVRPEKWKAPGTVTSEAASDLGSIQRDLNSTLPPLLSAAGSGAMTQLLPAYRNVEALYDVLVRVTQTSILAAPAQQSEALQQATQNLQQARRSFGDLLDDAAQSQARRLHDVQVRLTALQSTPPPPTPVCPPPPAPKKARPHAKPKPKPATPATTPSPTPAH